MASVPMLSGFNLATSTHVLSVLNVMQLNWLAELGSRCKKLLPKRVILIRTLWQEAFPEPLHDNCSTAHFFLAGTHLHYFLLLARINWMHFCVPCWEVTLSTKTGCLGNQLQLLMKSWLANELKLSSLTGYVKRLNCSQKELNINLR